jgi:disulfide bond formation protein DsbB
MRAPLAPGDGPAHIAAMRIAPHRRIALLCILVSGAALLIALGSERWAGLVPCALCLLERDPYRLELGLGALLLLVPAEFCRPVLVLLALVYGAGAALGVVHVGVEQGAWPSPLPECAAPHISVGSIADMLASMPATPSKPCDSPTYLVPFLPISMAAMNLALSLVFAVGLLICVVRGRRWSLREA